MSASNNLQLVLNKLRDVPRDFVAQRLDNLAADTTVDSKTGIYLAKLPDAGMLQHDSHVFEFYCARVLPGKYVNPHFHRHGEEPYVILGAGAEMNLGEVTGSRVVWQVPLKVAPGESVVVKEGQVHCLRNTGSEPLDFVFSCPAAHLLDHGPEQPEGDRYFTGNLHNGLPAFDTPALDTLR